MTIKAFDLAREGGLIDAAAEEIAALAQRGGDAARRDMYRAVHAITEDMIRARLTGDKDTVRELLAQSQVVLEIERLRGLMITQAALNAALTTATRVVANIALRVFAPPGI